jgi:hypothetical protein
VSQLGLFPSYTVHCFFGWCEHIERDDAIDGDRHERMEAHYRRSHSADIRRLLT